MNEGNAFINRDTINLLDLRESDRILEIGMGNGFFVGELLSRQNHLSYTGLDYSGDMVESAIELNRTFVESGAARFVQGPAHETPFEDHDFDVIFTINTIYFWSSVDETLMELSRVLKPGGRLYISIRPKEAMKQYPVVKYGFQTFSGEEIEGALHKHGFVNTEVKKIQEPEQDIWGDKGVKHSNIISGVKG
jgi:ubiquinone/menaquinone biosynthesis C-methylase UbiE